MRQISVAVSGLPATDRLDDRWRLMLKRWPALLRRVSLGPGGDPIWTLAGHPPSTIELHEVGHLSASEQENLIRSHQAEDLRRGFDLETPLDYYFADADGASTIEAQELDRVELRIGPGAAGALITPHGEKPLPIGAQIDPATSVFTWAAAAGFVGQYDFVLAWHHVRIVLRPKQTH